MDILTHMFLPLLMLQAMGVKIDRRILFLTIFSILPDFDVIFGIHRSYFHSFLFVILLLFVSTYVKREYIKYIAFFILSHLFLDFLDGGFPFLYPIIKYGYGMNIKLLINFKTLDFNFILDIAKYYPSSIHGYYTTFDNKGLVIALAFLAANLLKQGKIYKLFS